MNLFQRKKTRVRRKGIPFITFTKKRNRKLREKNLKEENERGRRVRVREGETAGGKKREGGHHSPRFGVSQFP